MGPEDAKRARALLARADLTANDVAAMMRVSRRSLFRHLKAARDHDELIARHIASQKIGGIAPQSIFANVGRAPYHDAMMVAVLVTRQKAASPRAPRKRCGT
jgi:hypothetical protein